MFKFVTVFSISCIALSCLWAVNARAIYSLTTREEKTECRNYHTDFTKGTEGWHQIVNGASWETTEEGLELRLVPPENTEATKDSNGLACNKEEGQGPTFNASTYMHYGTFSATVKSAQMGGAITAIILIADNGDEIDYELLGKGRGKSEEVQSNYFWGQNIVYGKNGEQHNVGNGPISENFHTYKVEWTPDKIVWSVDGVNVRTKTYQDADKEFPSSPARVQIGLWDGSRESGTAEWAHGPIEWNKSQEPISAVIKSVTIECDKEHNIVID